MPTPSITLTSPPPPAPGQARDIRILSGSAPTALSSTQTITSSYRNRYALYLAAQFNISAAAAFVEIDEHLRVVKNTTPASEADVRDVRNPGGI